MLKTPSGPAFLPRHDRRIYILWIGLVWIGMLMGFIPDLKNYLAEVPPPPLVLHLHGVVYFLWLIAVTVQIALVEVRNVSLHRQLGWWIVALSASLVPLGLIAAMVDMARQAAHPNYEPEFLGLEFQAMVVFPILLTLATVLRRDLAAHKRLMMLMPIAILDPGTSRLWSIFIVWLPPAPFGWWLHFFWGNAAMVVAMIVWDRWRHGRVHPALWSGAALIAAGEGVAVALQFSPAWHVIAGRLVTAWGWTG